MPEKPVPEQSAELVEPYDRLVRQVDQPPVAYPPPALAEDRQRVTSMNRAGARAASFAVLRGAARAPGRPEREQARSLKTTGTLSAIALASQDSAVAEVSLGRGRSRLPS